MSTLEPNPHQPIVLAQFPLAKYSYAETTSDQHGPVNWTHIQANELNVVFEKGAMPVSTLSSLQRLRLRVVRAREQLEDLDLNDLAREITRQAIARQTRNTKPLFAVLVKDPCLAIRYPSGSDQMHRFQLKFCSSRDYRDVLDIFRELNCPISETSGDHNMRSVSSRPDSSSSWITTSTIPAFTGNTEWSQHLGGPANTRPWNQGLLRSHTTVGTSIDRTSINASSTNSFVPGLHDQNSTTFTSLNQTQKDTLGAHSFSRVASNQSPELERPITAPTFDSQALDRVLPPKRDLPFSKPGPRSSHMSNQQSVGDAPPSGQLAGYISNTQDGSNNISGLTSASSRPHTARSRVTMPATSSPARQLRLELEDSRGTGTHQDYEQLPQGLIPASSPLLRTSAFGLSSPNTGSAGLHYTATTQSPKNRQSILSPRTRTKSPVPQQGQQQNQQPAIKSSSHDISNNSAPASATVNHTYPVTSADLAAYLTAPESERSQLVNNWICQQLEDDGFRALCQDVERVWQRIAFGTRAL